MSSNKLELQQDYSFSIKSTERNIYLPQGSELGDTGIVVANSGGWGWHVFSKGLEDLYSVYGIIAIQGSNILPIVPDSTDILTILRGVIPEGFIYFGSKQIGVELKSPDIPSVYCTALLLTCASAISSSSE